MHVDVASYIILLYLLNIVLLFRDKNRPRLFLVSSPFLLFISPPILSLLSLLVSRCLFPPSTLLVSSPARPQASLLIFTQSPSSFRLLPLSPFYKRMHARVARRAERLLILAPFPRGDCNLRFKYEVRLGHPRGGTYLPLASA